MNEIKKGRLILAGFLTLGVFVVLEILVESVLGRLVFSHILEAYFPGVHVLRWGWAEKTLNISIALLNCMILIWLYAALRPMFGVGTRTALITSLYWLVFLGAFSINLANLGYYTWKLALIEMTYQLLELPLALIAGAYFYEAQWRQ